VFAAPRHPFFSPENSKGEQRIGKTLPQSGYRCSISWQNSSFSIEMQLGPAVCSNTIPIAGGLDIYVAPMLLNKRKDKEHLKMNGASALVSMLSGYGVEVIFGVPGDTNVAFYEALRTTRDAPRHILCRDERSAVFMATAMRVCAESPAWQRCRVARARFTVCRAWLKQTSLRCR
jgi:thiamine pyrophosphate-dependent enzyme